MTDTGPAPRLSDIARAGFHALSEARETLGDLAVTLGTSVRELLDVFARAADAEAALAKVRDLSELWPDEVRTLDPPCLERLCVLVGASPALGDFFARHPDRLHTILHVGGRLIEDGEAVAELVDAVRTEEGVTATAENGWNRFRTRYRELLAELMLYDLLSASRGAGEQAFEPVARSLSALAAGAVEASLEVARATVAAGITGPPARPEFLHALRLGVVAMGKCGARELNVVSDVDVLFICDTGDPDLLDGDALIRLGTRVASETMRGIHDPAVEPPLWQLDANLRPEGRHGPLVRTGSSMLKYYDRWAETWEFQALLKARPLAGDEALGEAFVEGVAEAVWASAQRPDFVGSVQRMRQRVTEHIADDEAAIELKLGPGGLRDIEFSAQLLQLVHGQYDDRLRVRGTLEALRALVDGGYIARSDGEQLAKHYTFLRTLEHRLQLRDLRRTALMPTEDESLRVLARSSGLAGSARELVDEWERTKRAVRDLHLKIFYAPLLSAVAALPEEELVLGSDAARARLVSIGFRDPDGAMRHLAALTRGTTRRSRIHRNLMPVILQWLADGVDPDYGLLAFRRVSEANLDSPWYLRLLRDGTDAAERLMRVLSCSRFAAELLESMPDAVAWLEREESLQPLDLTVLREEMGSLASRRHSAEAAAFALRTVHRREVLRLALGRVTDVLDEAAVSRGLDAAHTALLDALLASIRLHAQTDPSRLPVEIALIGMGRYGGGELGFASDIDVLAVFRAPEGVSNEAASRHAIQVISELRRLVSDPRFPVDLDFDLRPEGKNGPLARSLDAYRSYYDRWSVIWETQALLRARAVAGDTLLSEDFMSLADSVRYPAEFGDAQVREVRRIKARVEAERLPHGEDRRRQLKLGPGGVSDVEWLLQLLQLEYAHEYAELRTVSTMTALEALIARDLLSEEEGEKLRAAWTYASSVRSAIKLWTGKPSDSLPTDWAALEGIANLVGIDRRRTSELEERWFAASRRSRAVFEHRFYGYSDDDWPVNP